MKFSTLKALYNDILFATPHPNQTLPIVIQFPVNNICNSRCQMCNIWQQKQQDEISTEEIRKVLSNKLFREVQYVGINGGEPTLRKDIKEVARAIIESLPKIKSLSLITNSINYKQVTNAIQGIGEVCKEFNVHLDVMMSLDGIGDVHDRVRGRNGNFETVVKVLDFVKNNPLVGSHRIGCTVIKENVFDVENVLNWCIENDVYARFRLGVRHQRLYNKDTAGVFELDADELYHFASFLDTLIHDYEGEEKRRNFYRSLRDQIVYGRDRSAGCDWKFRGVTLSSKGDLSYCAVESKVLGSAISEDSEDLYFSNTSHLNEIVSNKCSSCHHDYEGVADRKTAIRSVAKTVLNSRRVPKYLSQAIYTAAGQGVRTKQSFRDAKALSAANAVAKNVTHGPARTLPKRVLICGWYGTETLGDKAILGGIIAAQRASFPDCVIDVASLEPYVTDYTNAQMPDLSIDRVLHLSEAKAAVAGGSYSSVIIGGGPLMSNIAECTDLLELFTIAKRVGTRCIVGACGVGPLNHLTRNKVVAALLEIADDVVVRDTESAERARTQLGLTQMSKVTLDPAFHWINRHRTVDSNRNPKQVILALRDWPIGEYASQIAKDESEKIKRQFEDELVEFVDGLKELEPDIEIIPFCMHKRAVGGDDRAFYRRVFRDRPTVLANLDDRHRRPLEDLQTIERSRAMLAMRFHSVVFALGTNTPFVAVDYTLGGKIQGLLNDVNASSNLLSLKGFRGREAARNLLKATAPTLDLEEKIEVSWETLVNTLKQND